MSFNFFSSFQYLVVLSHNRVNYIVLSFFVEKQFVSEV